ncbi:MAG: Thermophilic serine proteinase precursor [Candidatus Heimdallarchaeota archaeon AB_125]|nr:MAG: Thermophilic serine proteinase precursor [Candidatus Heimdallarchaeota archaeon AB_125]
MSKRNIKITAVILLSFLILLTSFQQKNSSLVVSAVNYESSFHHALIESAGAWEITNGSSDITIALIDSGIDFSHPDLINSAWVNSGEIFNNSIDDDSNGYIDDYSGWDFNSNDSFPGPEVDDPIHWHGTFQAGIIAAPIDNDGIAGVAPNVTIMDLRVLNATNYSNITMEDFGNAIRYAVDNGADVISLSLQYYQDYSDYYDDIIYAINNNVPVVSATGNTWLADGGGRNFQSYPGGLSEVICVGATNENSTIADYSNYGEWTDIVAPVGNQGGTIKIIGIWSPDNYGTSYGTSFACDQVAAVVGLMRTLNYSLTVDEIKDILYRSSTDIGKKGKDILYGHGLLNASKAVRAVLDPSILITTKTSFYLVFSTVSFLVIALINHKKKK